MPQKTSNAPKLFIALLIIALSLSTFAACGSNSDEVKSDNPLLEDVMFSDEFRNDKTGKWRKALISVSEPAEEYAVDYYKDYFKSDDEIHFIYNFQLNTVNVLRKTGSETLTLSVHDYVSGEEHDAAKAAGGELLGEYSINLKTGESEKIQ